MSIETIGTHADDSFDRSQSGSRRPEVLALVVAWCREQPERVGEVLLPIPAEHGGHDAWEFGREAAGDRRLAFLRQRPGHNQVMPALGDSRLSRRQWIVRPGDEALEIDNQGKRPLLVDGQEVSRARVSAGRVVEVRGCLVLLVVRRPLQLPELELPEALVPAFGQADDFGMVGESPPAWVLRGELAFAAARKVHVLVGGPSGSGKELVAQAIHHLSSRAGRELVARNAATFPETLIDAELFGNMADYPNPGMRERLGLVGAAHGSTLFLDEIGELSHELQAHLLRVLDRGEYQRLGESRMRSADLRLVAATNRKPGELKHDFLARFRLRIDVPGLGARREDIPLLIPALIRRIAREDPALAQRFFASGDAGSSGNAEGWPRLEPSLVRALLLRGWSTHVRELESLLWTAMMRSTARGRERIGLDDDELKAVVTAAAGGSRGVEAQVEAQVEKQIAAPSVDPSSLSAEQIQQALQAAGGVKDRAWRLLGLRNRYQLLRLLKKHEITG